MELVVEDLSCARGGLPVIEGVGFRLPAGAALVLRGPNGSGKTTLLRTLAGLQPPVRGRIAMPPDAIAYGGHADGLKATLTARENLGFWAGVYGAGGGVEAALEAYELGALSDRPAQNLSAGQKRRLGLARLLVTGRPLWLLDEPTVSLDAHATGLFAAVIERHLAGGGMAVLATHIELGLNARTLDIAAFRARLPAPPPLEPLP